MSKLYSCTICNKKKQPNEFYIRQSGKFKGLIAIYQCKLCLLKAKKEAYDNNPEGYREAKRLRRENNPELYKAIDKKYREANIDVCRKRSNESSKKYYERYPEKLRAKSSKYRAVKLDRLPKWITKEEESQIRSMYKLCRKISKITGIPHEVDHVLPLQGRLVSGLHTISNLQIITKEQNATKSNKLLEDMI
jgi:hypothetical protein